MRCVFFFSALSAFLTLCLLGAVFLALLPRQPCSRQLGSRQLCSRLSALSSRQLCSRLSALCSRQLCSRQLCSLSSSFSALCSRQLCSRLSALGSRLSALGSRQLCSRQLCSRLSVLCSRSFFFFGNAFNCYHLILTLTLILSLQS